MAIERIGTDKRWASRYEDGWTVYDKTDGVIEQGLTREQAEWFLPSTEPLRLVIKPEDLSELLRKRP